MIVIYRLSFLFFVTVNPTAPTPLKSYNDLCLKPEKSSCSPDDGSKIIFTNGGECSEDFMKFNLDENGILRHHCSGKMVCPEDGETHNGAKVVLSSSCKEEDAKFEKTAGETGQLTLTKSGGELGPIHCTDPVPLRDSLMYLLSFREK